MVLNFSLPDLRIPLLLNESKFEDVYGTLTSVSNSPSLSIYGLNANIMKMTIVFTCAVLPFLCIHKIGLIFFSTQSALSGFCTQDMAKAGLC